MDHWAQDWMAALPEELWDVPLNHLAIPGSHDTMSYCLDINSPLVRSESDLFRILDGLCCCFTRPTIFKWATTQDRCIEEQLSMGIRYFDLRVARKPNDSSTCLHFTHILYTHVTVLDTLSSVAVWLDSHPKEIVILACRHFEGIDDEFHESFIVLLKKLFGPKLCRRDVSAGCRTRRKPLKRKLSITIIHTGSAPELKESVGVGSPGAPVLRRRGRGVQTHSAAPWHPLLVGQPTHSPRCHQLPGVEQTAWTSTGLLCDGPEPDSRQEVHRDQPQAVAAHAHLHPVGPPEQVAAGPETRVRPLRPQHHRGRLCGPASSVLAGHRPQQETAAQQKLSHGKFVLMDASLGTPAPVMTGTTELQHVNK
ncbi:uncharacterized protein LOC129188340 isoform X1 [Dunckerocampus dactyliophorus]|uniref:uncharacterized protein LOC129188340 isoform X1 n=1 Tax=Dunckerocampus dactyliophorus TaxID=161453 RepID=UPI002406DECE|nr:uncharacterized protein LOC129188340 isoform X1 [Dunckerocampus dactyliophorus]